MRIISCLVGAHNLWLVLLATLFGLGGTAVALRLFLRSQKTHGLQTAGWTFLTAVTGGSTIWCTHFIAILAYEPGATITFEPTLTLVSLIIAILGALFSLAVAAVKFCSLSVELGGLFLGLSIAAMHYTGFAAYRVGGYMQWDIGYVTASFALSIPLTIGALNLAYRRTSPISQCGAVALFALAIVVLHFTAMAAVTVYPMAPGLEGQTETAVRSMALGVALVGMIIVSTGVAGYIIDDRVRFEAFQHLQHLALSDPLTGLPNRHNFNEYLENELILAKKASLKLAVVGIDLDHFKEINDLKGHQAGDTVLRVIGERLAQLAREGEFVARVGGDEFSALKRFTKESDLLEFSASLKRALFQPLRLDGHEVKVGAGIGIAVFPDDGTDMDVLVNNADLAMYRAKADVTRSICFYEAKMDETARSRRNLANDLREAISRQELQIHYQVQMSVSTGEIRGYEVLLRWKHPQHGYIAPSDFIPIAEESGSIMEIGEWVLRTACKEAAARTKLSKIAVNLSPVQFAHSDLAKLVSDILQETGLPADRLEIEITESTIIVDKVRTLKILKKIKKLGVTVAIDDFGTSYSSLGLLRSFPFDKIKLDRSFISEIKDNAQAKAIIRAMLTLGKSLGIPVLVEGIETDYEFAILQSEGCDQAQGYFLGPPLPIEKIFPQPVQSYDDLQNPAFSDRIVPIN